MNILSHQGLKEQTEVLLDAHRLEGKGHLVCRRLCRRMRKCSLS